MMRRDQKGPIQRATNRRAATKEAFHSLESAWSGESQFMLARLKL